MNLEEDVKEWLSEEDLLREVKFDENADFHYIIEFPNDNIMDVVKPTDKDCIVIACATQVAPQHKDLMEASNAQTRKEFLMEVNFGLNSFLVDYELQVADDILQQFVITDQIFEDGLTKNEMMKTLKRVFKSKLQCIWLINEKFGSLQPNSTASNENDMFI